MTIRPQSPTGRYEAVPAEALDRLLRERDHLLLLHEALGDVDRAGTVEERLRVFVDAIRRIGFARVTLTLREGVLDPSRVLDVSASSGATTVRAGTDDELRALLARADEHRLSHSFWLSTGELLVPLRGSDGELIAALALAEPTPETAPSLARVRTVELFAQQVGSIIDNARLYEESEQERRRGEALAEIARAVGSSLRLEEVMRLSLGHAMALLRANGATLALLRDDADDQMVVVAAAGDGEGLEGAPLPVASVTGRSIRERRPIIVNDPAHDPETYGPTRIAANVENTAVAPLFSSTGAIGALCVINRADPFTDHDAAVLQRLADQVAVAVANARLYEASQALGERYHRVLETASDAILITDRERRITYANRAAERLFGIENALIGRRVPEFIPAELQDRVAELIRRTHAGEAQRFESTFIRDGGDRRHVEISTAPLHEGDEIVGTVGSVRDVTEERRARDAVAQSEARYRNLFESASDAIYTLDARGSFTSVNQATCQIAGRDRSELLGRSPLPFIAPRDAARVRDHFRSALAGTARRYECHFVRTDGSRRLVSVTNTPIRHGPHVIGVLGVARDVTEERERALALERSEARYTRLVETATDGIFTVDGQGRLTALNHALEKATGRERDVLIGTGFADLIDEADRALATDALAATLKGHRRRAELRYPSATGDTRQCSLMLTPVLENGEISGALGIVRDVTDEKRLADQLMQQEKLAAIGQLVSGVAHELNNPLASVAAFAQLLLAAPATPDQRRAIETIEQEARRAAKIVSNLLTFARQHQPERTVADLNRVVDDTVELRRYALRIAEVELELRLDPQLPVTWADPFQLQQVVLNLLTNAEQALDGWTGTRRIIVSTEHVPGAVRLRVSDTGPGIAMENLSRIFNPFFTTKPVGQGTGLGLSISDGIVREHGGRIRVESQPSQGASFVVELPHVEPPTFASTPRTSTAPTAASTKRLLVIEDEVGIRTAVQAFFRSLGHSVDAVASGGEGVTLAGQHGYDAVIVDLRLPDTTGDLVFEELRDLMGLADRVVFITGDTHSEAARRLLESTGRPVLSKPFLLDDLAAVVLSGDGDAIISPDA